MQTNADETGNVKEGKQEKEKSMYCKKCGKQIADDSKYCLHCGEILDERMKVPMIPKHLRFAWGLVASIAFASFVDKDYKDPNSVLIGLILPIMVMWVSYSIRSLIAYLRLRRDRKQAELIEKETIERKG